jgi:hypothetical protein
VQFPGFSVLAGLPAGRQDQVTRNTCSVDVFSNNFMQMKKIITAFFGICFLLALQNCSRHSKTNAVAAVFTELPEPDGQYQYIKNYFILSEQRKIEAWYSTYLNKCTLFYKIENPSKDSILNLIKSYWITSDQQKHDILSIQWRPFKNGKEVHVTMNYAYRIIAEDRVKQIPRLKLQIILNRRNKVISIKELSRGS